MQQPQVRAIHGVAPRRPIFARLTAIAAVAAVLILAPVVGAGLDGQRLHLISDSRSPNQTAAGVNVTASEDGEDEGDEDDEGDDDLGDDEGDDEDGIDEDDEGDDDLRDDEGDDEDGIDEDDEGDDDLRDDDPEESEDDN
jgi:hypothetical protein